MLNEELLESDTDDEDYVPPDEGSGSSNGKKCKKQRRPRRGITPEDAADDNANSGSKFNLDTATKQHIEEIKEKKRSDCLWSDFLKDVGGPTPKKAADESTSIVSEEILSCDSSNKQQDKVTVTRVFDFAGEEVRVSKVVAVGSKEAQKAKQDEEKKQQQSIPSSSTKPSVNRLPGLGKRPSGGISGLVSALNKKPKIGTLDKSKLDWEQFKDKEGIGEELQQFSRSKNSYVEKQQFLERTDLRQFEIERDMRNQVRKNKL